MPSGVIHRVPIIGLPDFAAARGQSHQWCTALCHMVDVYMMTWLSMWRAAWPTVSISLAAAQKTLLCRRRNRRGLTKLPAKSGKPSRSKLMPTTTSYVLSRRSRARCPYDPSKVSTSPKNTSLYIDLAQYSAGQDSDMCFGVSAVIHALMFSTVFLDFADQVSRIWPQSAGFRSADPGVPSADDLLRQLLGLWLNSYFWLSVALT